MQTADLLLCPHTVEKASYLPGGGGGRSLSKGSGAVDEASTLMTSAPPNTVPLGMKYQHVYLGRTQTFSLRQSVNHWRALTWRG